MSVTPAGTPFPHHLRGASTVEFGPFRFDHAERVLTRDGEEIRLPPRVLGVLQFLLERQGKVVSKQALLDAVWGDTAVTETSLTEAISLLRQALVDDAQSPRYLQTVHRRGYRFIADVTAPADIASEPISAAPAPPSGKRARDRALLFAIAIIATLAIAVIAFLATRRAVPPVSHVTISTGDPAALAEWSSLAISPDGRDIVFVAKNGGKRMLYHQSLDGFESRQIAGTDDAYYPFFSPDGEWVAYFQAGRLSKVKLDGGAPITICAANDAGGGTWGDDGSIVFSNSIGGLSRVPADGGEPETLTLPDNTLGEMRHDAPQSLPGGRSILFTIFSTTVHSAKVAVLSLENKQKRVVLDHAGGAVYTSGYIIYSSSDGVRVAPFDAANGKITGSPFATLQDVMDDPFSGRLHLSAASDGTIIYYSDSDETSVRELVRRDAAGRLTPLPTPPRYYRNLEPAPDGRRAAVTILDGERSDVWVADLETGTLNRLTFDGFNLEPVWSPDGEWVYYASNRAGAYNIYRRRASGKDAEERVLVSEHHQYPAWWSPDGSILVVGETDPRTSFDILLLRRGSDGSWVKRPFANTPAKEYVAEVSPDGQWIVYASSDGVAWNVFVQDFPDGRGKWQISTEGGHQPFWSADGRTLYYENDNRIVAVPLTFEAGGLQRGREQYLPDESFALVRRGPAPGELLAIRTKEERARRELRMITGWAASLRQR